MNAIKKALGRLGLSDPLEPEGAESLTAQRLADRVINTNNSKCWNHYRLIHAGGSRPRPVNGQWPLITEVHYLKEGEDGLPTVYVGSEDDPNGTFPLRPEHYVRIAPKERES